MKKLRQYAMTLLLVSAIFVAGIMVGHFRAAQAEPPEQGLTTVVYEILPGGSPTSARAEPNNTATEVDVLLWGDRVLWDGQTVQTDTENNRWIRVFLADGTLGWIPANFQDLNNTLTGGISTYLTANIAVGGTVTVTNIGNRAKMRAAPSVSADFIREVQAGETLQVIGGPYQAEYLMWWQYQDSQGNTGWIIDIVDWFQAN